MADRKDNAQKGTNRHVFLKILFGICCVGFIISIIGIISVQREYRTAQNTYSALREEIQELAIRASEETPIETEPQTKPEAETGTEAEPETSAEPETPAIPQQQSMDFAALQELNEDIVGWISSDGTYIDYPVLQGEDNKEYLHTLYNGKFNYSGSIFMDYRIDDPASASNVVLYGHHMRDGRMFAGITRYKVQSYYTAHPTMMYYAPEGDYLVELICGTVEDGSDNFIRLSFAGDEDLQAYVQNFIDRSTFESDVTLQPGDRIISLCTCSYETENSRYLLIGRLVPIPVG